MATIRIPPVLRPSVGGEREVTADGDDRRRGPARAGRPRTRTREAQLFGADGELNRYVNVYLNDEDVRVLDGLDTRVGEADTLVILPAMAGGARSTRRRVRGARPVPPWPLHFLKSWLSLRCENTPVRRSLRRHRPGDRQHAARRAQAPLAQARRPDLGQARVAQPDRLGQGPRRARADRGRRGEGR